MAEHPRTTTEIERGLLPVFRLFIGLRFALLLLSALANRSPVDARIQRHPGLGLIETGFLLLYLAWPRQRHGRFFLPVALLIASAGPVIEHALTVLTRLRNGAGPVQAATDAWLVIVVLIVPLVIASWQYGFKGALLLCVGTGLLETMLAVPIFRRGGPPLVTTFGLLFARTLIYLMVGYLVARLMAAQRAQRAELARANAQLMQYATTVERLTVSHERNRMARELHDTLAHTLSAVAVQLEAADSLWDTNPAGAQQSLHQAQQLTHSGLQETRRALHALRAQPLEDLGLALAVRQLAVQGVGRAGLTLADEIDPGVKTLRPDVEQSIYRVAEEAITNVVRHANARHLAVRLRREAQSIILDISDDGRGFDPSAPPENGHYGLPGMAERAALCGGILTINSQPGQGTRIRLVVERENVVSELREK
jgi:signal transduction histidine kinase